MSAIIQTANDPNNGKTEVAETPDSVLTVQPSRASPKQTGTHLFAALLVIAAISLGYAVQVANGALHPKAIVYLSIAFVAVTLVFFVPAFRAIERLGERLAIALLAAGFAFQLAILVTSPPGIYLRLRGPRDLEPFLMGLAVAGVIVGAALPEKPLLGRLFFPALVLIHFLLGVWLIKTSPSPHIDVYIFQRDSIQAFLNGVNPYSIDFPNIYGPNTPYYGANFIAGDRLRVGFIYPPLSLFAAIPGHLFGDYRYSQLVAMSASAFFIAFARPGRIGRIAAALFLFTPRTFFVLEQGWTEPFVVLLLSAVVYSAVRAPRGLPYLIGLFFVVKQYLVFVLPLAWLILPRPIAWRTLRPFVVKAAATAMIVTAPLALLNLGAFMRSVAAFQLDQPFRADALSYLAYSVSKGGANPPPTWLAFVAVGVLTAIALWRAPRTPGGFAVAIALVFLGFLAFNKQSFCNYYYFVLGAFCIAVPAVAPQNAGNTS